MGSGRALGGSETRPYTVDVDAIALHREVRPPSGLAGFPVGFSFFGAG